MKWGRRFKAYKESKATWMGESEKKYPFSLSVVNLDTEKKAFWTFVG